MRFDTSQHMRLGQHMKLAPRMIQSMEILQMPLLALQERIEQELESNVALEQADLDGDGAASHEDEEEGRPAQPAEDDARADSLEERVMVVGEQSGTQDWERLSIHESSYGEAWENEYSSSRAAPSGERDRKMDAMANVAARSESLTEQLLQQWRGAEVEPEIARAGEVLIGYIGKDGFLATDLATILEQNRNVPGLALDEALLERALRELQHWLDPPGIAARDARECFLLQIDELELHDEVESHRWDDVRRLIERHFDDLLQNRLPKIAQESGLSLEHIQGAIELMKRINRSPGKDLADDGVPGIVPDVVVEFDEEIDAYVAHLADESVPRLRVSQRYEQMARDRGQDRETREFVARNVRNAHWLIDSINQRKNTLLRVVNVVLARQREYFDQGPLLLKPLPMIEVADQLGIHVGTVSRAVADKWLLTPRGLVALRKFFSGGQATESGRDMSWDAIKATLKEIIDAEDRTRPMSDEALAAALKAKGIEIARRTVVKYRQQLGIPPARRRKLFV